MLAMITFVFSLLLNSNFALMDWMENYPMSLIIRTYEKMKK